MSALSGRPFVKMNGIGNEIIILDLRGTSLSVQPEEARAIARAPGLHYDQLMVLHDPRSAGTDAFMRILNNDGSEAGACGNGTRCVADFLMDNGARPQLRLETQAAVLECGRSGPSTFTVDMGPPRLNWKDIPLRDAVADTARVVLPDPPASNAALQTFGAVSMGNPHAIFFAERARDDLATIGPVLETHPVFPQKANISFAQVRARDHILLNVWERGAGITRACGSAACATLVAAVRLGLADRRARISLPGGDLLIEWRESDGHVLMDGPVEREFEGRFDAALFENAAA